MMLMDLFSKMPEGIAIVSCLKDDYYQLKQLFEFLNVEYKDITDYESPYYTLKVCKVKK